MKLRMRRTPLIMLVALALACGQPPIDEARSPASEVAQAPVEDATGPSEAPATTEAVSDEGPAEPVADTSGASAETSGDVESHLPYEVIEWADISHATRKRATARVLVNVSELPSADQLKLVSRLVRQEQVELWEEITVFVYLPGMDVQSAAYGIAEFHASGSEEFETQDYALAATKWYEQTPTAKREAKKREQSQQEHQQRVATGQAKSYELEVELVVVDETTLRVECTTDLPDDTVLSVTVGREYRMRGADASNDAYSHDYYGQDLSVSKGRVVATVDLDDKAWRKTVDDHIKEMRSLGLDMRLKSISDEVSARALYTSYNKSHPAHVVEVLGEDGQYVAGEQSRKIGKGRAISVETSKPCKLRK